jgi:hypothetical protein
LATSTLKAPSELRKLPFLFAELIPAGASLVSGVGYASRIAAGFATTLSAGTQSAESATLNLQADPKAGSLITVNPGGGTEEKFKVSAVSGSSAPFGCTLSHTTEFDHSGDNVTFEPGVSSRILVSPTATIVGSQAFLDAQFGADGQSYRISVVATLSNGEQVELEQTMVVTEIAPTETRTVQVDEIRDLAYGFDDPVALASSSLSSAIVFVSREETTSGTIRGAVAIGASTIGFSVNPGIGALMTLNPTGANQEKLKVSNVSGSSDPFTLFVNPTPDFAHNDGETANFEPGVTTRLLTSPTVTITGTTAIVRKRRGAAGKTYRVTLLGTLANGEKIHHAGHVAVVEN